MAAYRLGKRSYERLQGVHDDLVEVVVNAINITRVDFTVLEGLRSLERQRELYRQGATRTMNSRHLTGHAVDLGAWIDGRVDWSWGPYYDIADAMKEAAVITGVSIEWGGDWKTFKDGPHYQLPWSEYPA